VDQLTATHSKYIFFLCNATTCSYGLRGLPSWAWHNISYKILSYNTLIVHYTVSQHLSVSSILLPKYYVQCISCSFISHCVFALAVLNLYCNWILLNNNYFYFVTHIASSLKTFRPYLYKLYKIELPGIVKTLKYLKINTFAFIWYDMIYLTAIG
jgi:hypothetical protein